MGPKGDAILEERLKKKFSRIKLIYKEKLFWIHLVEFKKIQRCRTSWRRDDQRTSWKRNNLHTSWLRRSQSRPVSDTVHKTCRWAIVDPHSIDISNVKVALSSPNQAMDACTPADALDSFPVLGKHHCLVRIWRHHNNISDSKERWKNCRITTINQDGVPNSIRDHHNNISDSKELQVMMELQVVTRINIYPGEDV